MERFNFVLRGIGSPYYNNTKVCAEGRARKHFGISPALWKVLKSNNKISVNKQVLVNGYWKY